MILKGVPPAILAALGLGSGCTQMSVCLSATGDITESDTFATDSETGTGPCLGMLPTDSNTGTGTTATTGTGTTGTADTGTGDTGTGDTGTGTSTGTTGIAPPSRPDVLRNVEAKLPADVVERLRRR